MLLNNSFSSVELMKIQLYITKAGTSRFIREQRQEHDYKFTKIPFRVTPPTN